MVAEQTINEETYSAPSRFRAMSANSALLLVLRVVVGGVLLAAASQKIQSPKAFALSIDAFGLVPRSLIPTLAYLFIWEDILAGGLLVLGVWSRAAAVASAGLLAVFIGALASAVLRGLPIDCGCFGALFRGPVGWSSVLRNVVLIAMAAHVVYYGGGKIAIERLWEKSKQKQV